MNVLLVSEPGRDGVFRHVEGLTRFLIGSGVRTHLAYSDLTACDQLYELVAHVEAAGGRTLNMRIVNAPGPRDVVAFFALRRLAAEVKADVVHGHSSKAGVLVRAMAPFTRARIFYTSHAYFRMHEPGGITAQFFHAIERLFARAGTTINMSGCESRFAREVLGLKPERQLIIANGVDCARFAPASPEEKARLRESFGVPAGARVLGTVGRMSLQKDPLTMYEALAHAPGAEDVFFLHLGRGELSGEVDALIAQRGLGARVRQIPYMADTRAFYAALDGFILTSLYEGMSYAVLEALAVNLPLVLTRCPGNRDFAGRSLSDLWWAEPREPAGVAQAIEQWRRKLDEKSEPNHREIALREFSEETCFGRVLAAYAAAV